MSFPTLTNDTLAEGDPDDFYAEWVKSLPGFDAGLYDQVSAYLDPELGPAMHEAWRRAKGVNHMYGGFLKDRSRVLKGTYLDETGGYIHQGVDYFVPAGTPIAIDFAGTVVCIDCDHPEPGGWGTRLGIVRDGSRELYLLAHLGPVINCRLCDHVEPGQVIATVGAYPNNGGWTEPHLHLQGFKEEGRKLFYRDPRAVDGYGHPRDAERNARLYFDPTPDFILPNTRVRV